MKISKNISSEQTSNIFFAKIEFNNKIYFISIYNMTMNINSNSSEHIITIFYIENKSKIISIKNYKILII